MIFFLITIANVVLVKGSNLKKGEKLTKTDINTFSRDNILIETGNKLKAKIAKMKNSTTGRKSSQLYPQIQTILANKTLFNNLVSSAYHEINVDSSGIFSVPQIMDLLDSIFSDLGIPAPNQQVLAKVQETLDINNPTTVKSLNESQFGDLVKNALTIMNQ